MLKFIVKNVILRNIGFIFLGCAILAAGYKVTHSYNSMAHAIRHNTAVAAKSQACTVTLDSVLPKRKQVVQANAPKPQHKPTPPKAEAKLLGNKVVLVSSH